MNAFDLISFALLYGGIGLLGSIILDFVMPDSEYMNQWESFVRQVLVAAPTIVALVTISAVSILLVGGK